MNFMQDEIMLRLIAPVYHLCITSPSMGIAITIESSAARFVNRPRLFEILRYNAELHLLTGHAHRLHACSRIS